AAPSSAKQQQQRECAAMPDQRALARAAQSTIKQKPLGALTFAVLNVCCPTQHCDARGLGADSMAIRALIGKRTRPGGQKPAQQRHLRPDMRPDNMATRALHITSTKQTTNTWHTNLSD